MINYRKGDLFITTDRVIAHGCNSLGVMGKGVAKLVKEKYPKAFLEYHQGISTSEGRSSLGAAWLSKQPDGKIIYNLITQLEYAGYNGSPVGRRYVNYDALYMSLFSMGQIVKFYDYGPISMPKIGAGLGGGDWRIISNMIEVVLAEHEVTIWELGDDTNSGATLPVDDHTS